MSKFDRYFDAATDAFNAGFASKAAQQRALQDVGRAFDAVKEHVSAQLLATPFDERDAAWKDLYWGMPPHAGAWNAKHAALYRRYSWACQSMADLVALRNEIKAAPIVPPARTNIVTETETKVRETLRDMIERKTAQFHEGVALVEIFGKLPVTVTPHWVVNDKGTGFIRCFYYLNGKLTALNVILAVLEATREDA